MSYHQWLNSTSNNQQISASVYTKAVQIFDPSIHSPNQRLPARASQPGHQDPPLSSTSYQSVQATMATANGYSSYPRLGKTHQVSAAGQSDARYYPSLKRSHVQRPAEREGETSQSVANDFLADEVEYHEAMSRITGSQWSEQLSKSFLPSPKSSMSRDAKGLMRPPPPPSRSFAATHPANYGQKASKSTTTPLPQSFFPREQTTTMSSPSARNKQADLVNPFSLSAEVPWRSYTDPMWQTSSDPPYWSNNRTTLKSDSNTDHGNVVSPTWMIGLPFGGMTEMADSYPCDERQDAVATDRR